MSAYGTRVANPFRRRTMPERIFKMNNTNRLLVLSIGILLAAPFASADQAKKCDPTKFHIYPNGGGKISDCADVQPGAFIDQSSTIEGGVYIESGAIIKNSTVKDDPTNLSKTILPPRAYRDNYLLAYGKAVNDGAGTAIWGGINVENSTIFNSSIHGDVSNSKVRRSILKEFTVTNDSTVNNSYLAQFTTTNYSTLSNVVINLVHGQFVNPVFITRSNLKDVNEIGSTGCAIHYENLEHVVFKTTNGKCEQSTFEDDSASAQQQDKNVSAASSIDSSNGPSATNLAPDANTAK